MHAPSVNESTFPGTPVRTGEEDFWAYVAKGAVQDIQNLGDELEEFRPVLEAWIAGDRKMHPTSRERWLKVIRSFRSARAFLFDSDSVFTIYCAAVGLSPQAVRERIRYSPDTPSLADAVATKAMRDRTRGGGPRFN